MKRLTRALIPLVSCHALTAAIPVAAAVTVYHDRPSFEAAVGPHVTYTFDPADGFPAAPAPVTSVGPATFATFNAAGGPAQLSVFPPATDNQILSGLIIPGDDIRFGTSRLFASFAIPQHALGFDVYPLETLVVAVVRYGGSTPTEAGYLLNLEQDVAFGSSTFFGLVSTDPILGFSIGSVADDSRDRTYKGIDNLTLVPEPGVLSFLVALTGFACRRRSAKAHASTATTRPCMHKTDASTRGRSQRFPLGAESLEHRRLLSVSSSFAGTLALDVGRNVNISRLSEDQIYADVAVDPFNPSRMFEISNRFGGAGFTAWSDDAGETWTQSNLMPSTTLLTSDGKAAFDAFGNLFIVYCDQGAGADSFVTLAVSTDGGRR